LIIVGIEITILSPFGTFGLMLPATILLISPMASTTSASRSEWVSPVSRSVSLIAKSAFMEIITAPFTIPERPITAETSHSNPLSGSKK
jgi:hypothetical protein